jgi:hypothetical protein
MHIMTTTTTTTTDSIINREFHKHCNKTHSEQSKPS